MMRIKYLLFIIFTFICNNNSFAQKNDKISSDKKSRGKIPESLSYLFIDSVSSDCGPVYYDKNNPINECTINYYCKRNNVFTLKFDSIGIDINTNKIIYSINYMSFSYDSNSLKTLIPEICFYGNQSVGYIIPKQKKWENLTSIYDYYPNGETRLIKLTNQEEDTLIKLKYENGFPKLEMRLKFPSQNEYNALFEPEDPLFYFFNFSDGNNVCIEKNNDINVYYSTYRNRIGYNGTYKTWYDNGQAQIFGQYSNSYPSETWFYYKKNGKLIRKEEYKNGISVKCKPCGDVSEMFTFKLNRRTTLKDWLELQKLEDGR